MICYNFTKTVRSDRLQQEITNAGLTSISYIDTVGTEVYVYFSEEQTTEQLITLSNVVTGHTASMTSEEYTEAVVKAAREFGNRLIDRFSAENIRLGITQAGMTNTVRKRLSEVTNALYTGSIKDAITEARAIPSDHKDPVFITDARLLLVINQIEQYCGMPLSTEL